MNFDFAAYTDVNHPRPLLGKEGSMIPEPCEIEILMKLKTFPSFARRGLRGGWITPESYESIRVF
jgi:hypothetical protein